MVVCLLLGVSMAPAQTTTPAGQTTAPAGQATAPAVPAQGVEGLIRPETVATRKDAVQKRLETLADLLLSQEEAEAAVRVFLSTPFSHGEVHMRRLAKF